MTIEQIEQLKTVRLTDGLQIKVAWTDGEVLEYTYSSENNLFHREENILIEGEFFAATLGDYIEKNLINYLDIMVSVEVI